ncbi:MAG: ATP-binding protein [Pseudomonadota bacterium]|nr:ATP-binding protein [Pseudomonadota bacterium]
MSFKWDVSRVAAIINAKATEGQTLEFKAELPASNDRGKSEFLKDVSALANASGGAILFGIKEKAGEADSLAGLHLADPDSEMRRLSQTLESGVEPRVAGVQFVPLKLGESDVLVVDVPQSFDAPHRYLFNGHSKFVQRSGTHVAELSYDQLRSAFNRSAERLDRLRQAWANDLSLDHTWRQIERGPVGVLRVASLVAADGKQVIDPQAAHERWSELILPGWGGGSPFYNYDGFAVAPGRDEASLRYSQVHRVGAISSFSHVGVEYEGQDLFIAGRAERFFVEASQAALTFLANMGLAGSAILHAGVTRLAAWSLAAPGRYGSETLILSQVNRIELPELFIEDISGPGDITALLRPGFDVIWQAFGRPGCPHYSAEGVWSVR